MYEILLFAAGVAATSVGVGLGMARERRRKPVPPNPPSLTCGCEHELAMHDPETNRCYELVNGDPVKLTPSGYALAFKKVQCPCRQYTGARPYDQVFFPRVMPREERD